MNSYQLFQEAVHLTLQRWAALKLAIEMDSENQAILKAQELQSLIMDFFQDYGSNASAIDLSDNLNSYFSHELNVGLEDDSEIQVASHLVSLFQEIVVHGKVDGLNLLRSKVKSSTLSLDAFKNASTESDTDDDIQENGEGQDMEMTDSYTKQSSSKSTPYKPIIDDDGFTLVQNKKNRK